MTNPILATAGRMARIGASLTHLTHFLSPDGLYTRLSTRDGVCDFAFGNPHNLPLPEITQALQRWAEPRSPDWFAYKQSEPQAREVVAATLQRLYGAPFDAENIHMTNSAFAGLAVVLSAILEPGDEVIFNSPPWFFYESLILNNGGEPLRVRIDPQTHDLDLAAIEAAISPRTRAVLVNSPNNPTGRIYPQHTLRALADLLEASGRRIGRTIYMISDEAYSRILFDGRSFSTPTLLYPHSFLVYTYGKTLLMPGQRVGYIALPPDMPNRRAVSEQIWLSQLVTGWAFPNALLQHALGDLERLSIDIPRLQRKRDHMVAALQGMGYALRSPEATFYLLVKSPLEDADRFCERLAQHNVLVLPGPAFEMPGYFRISLTANEEMIERSLEGFAAAIAV